jgi:hypothetical protein
MDRLPLQDIVAATGVCKFWRDALKSNSQVQEALFLKPAEICEVVATNAVVCGTADPIAIDGCYVIGAFHPSLTKICGSVRAGGRVPPLSNEERFPKFEHHEGTWREMFITQPPCKAITLQSHKWPGAHPCRVGLTLEFKNNDGVKLGELYDFIHSIPQNDLPRAKGLIHINMYATEDNMEEYDGWDSRCQVRNGEVCRPANVIDRRRWPKEPGGELDRNSFFDDYYYSSDG